MVLFQIPIVGPTNTSTTVNCPFYGKYKVKLLSISLSRSATPTPADDEILVINSKALWSNFAGGQFLINSFPFTTSHFNTNSYEFITDSLHGYIDISLTLFGVTPAIPPTDLNVCLLTFDFEKYEI